MSERVCEAINGQVLRIKSDLLRAKAAMHGLHAPRPALELTAIHQEYPVHPLHLTNFPRPPW